jgi:hypothetical protein
LLHQRLASVAALAGLDLLSELADALLQRCSLRVVDDGIHRGVGLFHLAHCGGIVSLRERLGRLIEVLLEEGLLSRRSLGGKRDLDPTHIVLAQ